LADQRGGRRRAILVALALDAALFQALAHAPDFATLLVARALEGAAHITALSLLTSLCADASGDRRGRVMGMVGAGLTLGVALGAALGGRLGRTDPVATLHAGSLILALAVVFGALALPGDVPASARPDLRSILRTVASHRELHAPLLLAFTDRFTVGFFTFGFPLLCAGVHDMPAPRIGALLAAFLLPFALLSYPFGRLAERWSIVGLAALGSVFYGVGAACVGTVPPELLWLVMPLLGIGSAVFFVPTLLLVIAGAPAGARSTATAAFHAVGSLGFLLGPLACGAIVAASPDAATGYALAFAFAGAAELVSVLPLLPRLRDARSSQQR
jgi:MFS family permease